EPASDGVSISVICVSPSAGRSSAAVIVSICPGTTVDVAGDTVIVVGASMVSSTRTCACSIWAPSVAGAVPAAAPAAGGTSARRLVLPAVTVTLGATVSAGLFDASTIGVSTCGAAVSVTVSACGNVAPAGSPTRAYDSAGPNDAIAIGAAVNETSLAP